MNCKDNGTLSSAAGSDEHQMTLSMSSEMQVRHLPTKNNAAHLPAPVGNIVGKKPGEAEIKRECHKYIECEREFKRGHDLKDHMTVRTRVLRSRELRHKCMVCEKGFRAPYAVKEHMNIHTGECNFPCEVCGQKFSQRRGLQIHMYTHSTDRPHKCKLCTSAFKRPNHLTRHVFAVHDGKRKIRCNDCNRYYFPSPGSEVRHAKKYHVGEDYRIDERPYKCILCDARFIERWSVRVHADAVHSDERPYLCTVCGKTFKKAISLQRHSAIHMEAEKVSTECKVCQKMVKANAMYIHMKSHGEKKFLCNICGKKFSLKHHLSAHEKSHQGVRAHACELCDKRFILPHQLRAHRKTHSVSEAKK
ncbi:zinc finger protein 320-like [Haliotis cracherodii]|uniref:zinc finger protein 320-like n=1 Tax=Haliotis cracherodii TaxID=6455 RepID=UPI0039ED94AB